VRDGGESLLDSERCAIHEVHQYSLPVSRRANSIVGRLAVVADVDLKREARNRFEPSAHHDKQRVLFAEIVSPVKEIQGAEHRQRAQHITFVGLFGHIVNLSPQRSGLGLAETRQSGMIVRAVHVDVSVVVHSSRLVDNPVAIIDFEPEILGSVLV